MFETRKFKSNMQFQMAPRKNTSTPNIKENLYESIRPIDSTIERELRRCCSAVVLGLPNPRSPPALPPTPQKRAFEQVEVEPPPLSPQQQSAFEKFDFRLKELPSLEKQESLDSSVATSYTSSPRSSTDSATRTWSECTTHYSDANPDHLSQHVKAAEIPPLPPRSSSITVPRYGFATTATAKKLSIIQGVSPLLNTNATHNQVCAAPVLVRPTIVTVTSVRPRTTSGVPGSPRFRNSSIPSSIIGNQSRAVTPNPFVNNSISRAVTPGGRLDVETASSHGLGIHIPQGGNALPVNSDSITTTTNPSAQPIPISNAPFPDVLTPDATPTSSLPTNGDNSKAVSPLTQLPPLPTTIASPHTTFTKNIHTPPTSPPVGHHHQSQTTSNTSRPPTPKSMTRRNTDQQTSHTHTKKFSLFPTPIPTPIIENGRVSVASNTRPRTSQGTASENALSPRISSRERESMDRPLPPLPVSYTFPHPGMVKGKDGKGKGNGSGSLEKDMHKTSALRNWKKQVLAGYKSFSNSLKTGKKSALSSTALGSGEKVEKVEKEKSEKEKEGGVGGGIRSTLSGKTRSRRGTLKDGSAPEAPHLMPMPLMTWTGGVGGVGEKK